MADSGSHHVPDEAAPDDAVKDGLDGATPEADRGALEGRNVLLGVSGSIAAYKAASLVRLLKKAGASVQVLMTPDAERFIPALTLGTLSEREVLTEIFPEDENADDSWTKHVTLGLWADLFVVAPATAQTIAKLAHGFSDSMLTATALSARCPVLVCPAMDRDMYRHPATRRNLEQLQAYGYEVMPAAHGELASGLVGQGRLPEPDAIVDRIAARLAALPDGDSPSPDADGEASEIGSLERPLAGRRVLVTAGPTREPIDPVRVLTNPSTGTMGYALAEAAARRGAQVTLVSGPTALETPPGVERVDVTTAEEMHEAVQTRREATDLFFMAAAVADFTPADPSDTKLKKDATGASDEDEAFVLRLRRTPDILRTVGTHRRDDQVLVGFALETDDGLANARRKLEAKHLDWIALNNLRDEGAGFGTGTNQVTLLHRSGATETLPRMPKRAVADAMLDRILAQGLPAPAAGEAAGTPPGDAHADESTEAATSGGPPS